MKRLLPFILIALVAVGFGGTALAANSVELGSDGSGVSTVYWGATFSTATGGASAYVATGGVGNDVSKGDRAGGTTLYAISNTRTNAAGTELATQRLIFVSGATPLGAPQLLSGATDAVIFYAQALQSQTVGNSTTDSGTSLWSIDGGTGVTNWELGIPGSGLGVANTGGIFNNADAGTVPYSISPVTIDDESASTAGATVYGVVSGIEVGNNKGGASIFAVNAATGAFATISGSTTSSVTGLNLAPFGQSAVSSVNVAPLITGTTGIYVVGFGPLAAGTVSGLTILQFDKNNLAGGHTASATVNLYSDLSDQWIPTPVASGGSIFVVDNNGGVSAYAAVNLALQYSVDYAGNSFNGGVTGAPVTNGDHIVLCATGSVSGYRLNNLSGNSKEWTYDFGNPQRYTIRSTPAISNGYVWVTVNDNVADADTIWRFTLGSTYDGDPQIAANVPETYASPIVVGEDIWTVSYDPLVEKIPAVGANGEGYWPQLKFNKAKTGNNTADDDAVVPGSGGGCFISTIK